MLFSKRQGIIPPLKGLQIEGIDDDLRNRLWNALQIFYWDKFKGRSYQSFPDEVKGSNMEGLLFAYWNFFFKWPIDEMPPRFYKVHSILRRQFFSFPWNQVYDFLEFTIKHGEYPFAKEFPVVCNSILEDENAGYRLVNNLVAPITSEVEIQSIEDLVKNAEPFPGVRTHISTALALMSDRKDPDYRNSIKESISAVESACQVLANDPKATLDSALKVLEKRSRLHGAFKSGISKLYGYTSDADGIRHALLEESGVTFSDAKFMLVICSAFVNYLIGKAAELQINLKGDA
jgi:hypothetical protein